jgi:uncharacterized protein (TIGR02145 family)
VPDITLVNGSGNASQTVNQNTAIAAMTYTASDAATISMTGSFPTGVTGAADGSSYTISGTPTAAGTFSYSLTAAVGGCTSTAAAGTLTVNAGTPSGAASTQTWVVGNQTWSAPLKKAQAGCIASTDFGYTNPPTTAYYRSSGLYSGSGYLYNWKCVSENSNSANATSLCPSPWRVPTQTDFSDLDKAFVGGTGDNRSEVDQSWITANYINAWGGVYGGFTSNYGIYDTTHVAYYWSQTVSPQSPKNLAYYMRYTYVGAVSVRVTANQYFGYQVRCVKD